MGLQDIKLKISKHKKTLKVDYHVKKIGIFGSYARNEQKEGSDLDIIVEFYEPISLLGLVRLENYLSDILGIKVDLIPKEDVRFELKKQIVKEAVYV